MHWFSLGVAFVAAVAIIAIGIMYLSQPRAATLSFGLPLPEPGSNIVWWLRLKGIRDVVSGLVVLAVAIRGESSLLGIVLIIAALTPLGDMSVVLAARGSMARALGVHGVTATLMIVAGALLVFRYE